MSEREGQVLARMTALRCPVPSCLETALGYAGNARFVAFLWTPYGDDLVWDDGTHSKASPCWAAWQSYTGHRAVALHLDGFFFGDSERPARHAFLLDRRERRAYAGRRSDVARLLAVDQETIEPPGGASPVTSQQVRELLAEKLSHSLAPRREWSAGALETEARLAEEARVYDRMLHELDGFDKASEEGLQSGNE